MTPNNNISILPFYSSLSKQNHRKDYANGNIFCLPTPLPVLPSFQIIKEYNADSLTSVAIVNLETNVSTDITSQVSSNYHFNPDSGHQYVVVSHPYGQIITGVSIGRYYLVVTFGTTDIWYSDVFVFVNNITEYLKIQYFDKDDLILPYGKVSYAHSFRWVLYLPTQLGRPTYEFEEEVTKRDGYDFQEKQISQKTFVINFLSPEYLLDAMRIIRMSDAVFISNKGDSYYVDKFLMTPKWESDGFLASVEAEFQCDTVIKKIGKVFTASEIGDFNDDFNNDFS